MTYRAADKTKRLSILHKGLIILAIPLLFELAFLMLVIHLLDHASKQIAEEVKSQDTIVAVESVIKELADSTTSATLYNVTRMDEFLERNLKSRARLNKSLAKLLKLVGDDEQEREAAQRLQTSAMSWFGQQDRAIREAPKERMHNFFAIPGFSEAQHLMVFRPEGAARIILEKERRRQSTRPQQRQAALLRFQIIIFIGLAVNIGMTLFLARNFFAKYVLQRIENVLTNTLKLGSRMPLDPPMRGTDEIADLDHAFHKTANEILAFEKFKEQLVAVVSHELRTPLTSVQGTMTLIEAGALGDFSEKALEEVEAAQVSLKKLIDLVNNLLLLERLEAGRQFMREDELSVDVVIQKAINELQEFSEYKNISVQCQFDELKTTGDSEKLLQALIILLETSHLRAPENSAILVTGNVVQDKIEIRISDAGPPLNTVQAQGFFDRTREFDEQFEDRSNILQLALSKAIIVTHSGSVSINASDGQMTTFVVKLPIRRRIDA